MFSRSNIWLKKHRTGICTDFILETEEFVELLAEAGILKVKMNRILQKDVPFPIGLLVLAPPLEPSERLLYLG